MNNVYKFMCLFTYLLFSLIHLNSYAQPVNDECSGAIDISEAFNITNCGDVTTNGPFDLTGSTPGVDDPPEPGEQGICPNETDPNLFGDDSDIWENSVWYTFTVPDINGDGSDVTYSLWTSDGSFRDDCGITNILGGETDTQVAIYAGPDCPNSATGECDHYAASEDLFTEPPWISGWLSLDFTPGETYYMGVDGWDAVEGEFCLTVAACGVECGDGICAPVEDFCDCQNDCPCTFGDISAVAYNEELDGLIISDDLSGNLFLCSEYVNGLENDNVYLPFIVQNWADCSGIFNPSVNITLSNGQITFGATDNGDGTLNIPTGVALYIELTPADIAAGSLTITSAPPDGSGGTCDNQFTINFDDFPQATDPFCILNCATGGVNPFFENIDITICEGQPYSFFTGDFEELTTPCTSDNGSSYVFGWRPHLDLYGIGTFEPVTDWQILGINPIFDTSFFLDEFGIVPPYFTAGSAIDPLDPYTGLPRQILIQGASLCINADGSIDHFCPFFLPAISEDSGVISATYLPADDPLCSNMEVEGCIDEMACNYTPDATVDDGSCNYAEPNFDCNGNCLVDLDCTGECGGNATEGTACTDANGDAGVFAADCSCIAGNCEEEITGSVSAPDPICDLSGINLIVTAPDGSTITTTTDADGTFMVPGGPFPCGTYTATFEDVNNLPTCYTNSGSTEPINFELDGNPNTMDGPNFIANPTIPTLSQWGLIIFALLLMTFGSIQLWVSTQQPLKKRS